MYIITYIYIYMYIQMESNGTMDPTPFFLLLFDLPSVFAAFTTSRERFMTCMVFMSSATRRHDMRAVTDLYPLVN